MKRSRLTRCFMLLTGHALLPGQDRPEEYEKRVLAPNIGPSTPEREAKLVRDIMAYAMPGVS